MKKVHRIVESHEDVRLLNNYLHKHIEEKAWPVRITLERHTKTRTSNQNSLMHLWFGEIAQQVGDDPRSVKADLKAMFLPSVEGTGGVMRPKDTHELSTPEAMDFMTQIQILAGRMGWHLTQP